MLRLRAWFLYVWRVIKIPWLFNEDMALKQKLQGIQVFDKNDPNGRNVKVRFRLPETEISNLDFPIIVISHNGWYLATEREHRGFTNLPYAPENFAPWWDDSGGAAVAQFKPTDSPYFSYFPLPYNFDYIIDVYTRFMFEHAMPIISQLAAPNRLDPKFGFLDIPQDGTKRTMQLLGGPDFYTQEDENGKRLFQISYLIRVFSELVPAIVQAALANIVNIDLSVYADTADLHHNAMQENVGIISASTTASWNS